MDITFPLIVIGVAIVALLRVKNKWFRIAIGIAVAFVVVGTVGSIFGSSINMPSLNGPGIFYSIVIGVILLFLAGTLRNSESMENLPKLVPTILASIGWIVIGFALLSSGFGRLIQSSVDGADIAALCVAEPQKSVCVERRQAREAKQKLAVERKTVPVRAATQAVATQTARKAPVVKDCAWNAKEQGLVECQTVTIFEGGEPFYKETPFGTCLHGAYNPKNVTERQIERQIPDSIVFEYTVKPGKIMSTFDVFGWPVGTNFQDEAREAAGLPARPCPRQ